MRRLFAKFKPIPFGLGLAAFAALALLDSPLRHFGEHGALPALAAGVTAWMAIWWIGEAVPLWLTALIPLVVYPLSSVHGDGRVANIIGTVAPYFDPYIFLFLGGMGIAAAMQQWNLHRRVALGIMLRVGTAPGRLLFGVLAATAFVSLWISNTATAAMMLPIGLAVLRELERQTGRRLASFGCAMMLGFSAEKARQTTKAKLKAGISKVQAAKSPGVKTEQLKTLLQLVDDLDEGAFVPLWRQPPIRALLLPISGIGWTALLEYRLLPGL